MKIERFEQIQGWQEARSLTRTVYDMTRKDGFARDFGLRDQIQRSSVSVMANIAEGFERRSRKEFTQFLGIALGSCAEVRSHLYVALDQDYISDAEFKDA